MIPLQSVIVLIRYRAMVPFMLSILIVIQLGARAIHLLHPDTTSNAGSGEPIGFYVNLGILALTIVAFILSIARPRLRPHGRQSARP